MARYASGKQAKAICDICGFTCKYHELKAVYEKGRATGSRVCPDCWSPDHPQNFLGLYPVEDPQALRNPRPDHAELAAVRAQIQPVLGVRTLASLGTITVSTP